MLPEDIQTRANKYQVQEHTVSLFLKLYECL